MATRVGAKDRTRQGETSPPESATAALARARKHSNAAIAEALAAARALLDAAALVLSGEASADHAVLGDSASGRPTGS